MKFFSTNAILRYDAARGQPGRQMATGRIWSWTVLAMAFCAWLPAHGQPASGAGTSGKPLGYAGSAAAALEQQGDFLPIPDRWRIGFPADYRQNVLNESLLNPYKQNVLKGDYPVFGTQDVFFSLTVTSDTLFEARQLPVPSGVSTVRPDNFTFFGSGRQALANENLIFTFDLFKGDAGYVPREWDFRATPVFNGSYVHVSELQGVNTNFAKGLDRADGWVGFQELFIEKRLDPFIPLSSNFDFASIRAGIQGFTSDFRGFLFSDNEPGVRLFGTLDNNKIQYNLAWFTQLEKDTNSGLNTFNPRGQDVFIANIFRQDFLFPGYTGQLSFQSNIDTGGEYQINKDGFLVRPAPIGAIRNKDVKAYYLGWAGDGHIGRFNITHQFYQALGTESFNPIPAKGVEINAQFFALELSYDRDWIRYRASFAWASGDHHPQDNSATGFDSIFDNPNFAGGGINFFTRQAIALTDTGVNLVNRNSLLPDLRTSKEQGQANFVNPGLFLYNIGFDADITPKLKLITNASYLQFDSTQPLKLLLHDNKISSDIGIDLSVGLQYRPLLSNNIIINAGAATLLPGQGFKDIYTSQALYSFFTGVTVTY
jgi:hypothetical protein